MKPQADSALHKSSLRTPATGPQCHTCRKRRVRCDSTIPTCQKCTTKGVECLGYEKQRPLVWLEGGGSQNRYLGEASLAQNGSRKKRGRPKLVVAKSPSSGSDAVHPLSNQEFNRTQRAEDEEIDHQDGNKCTSISQIKTCGPEQTIYIFPAEVKVIVQAVYYFDKVLVPEMDPIVYTPRTRPVDPINMPDNLASLLWNTLICVVDTHKAIKTQPHESIAYGESVYKSKSQAYMALNNHLRDPDTQLAEVTLFCVLALFLAETQCGATGAWLAHFQGAKRIIELKGGLGKVRRQCPSLTVHLSYFMLTDVMTLTTLSSGLSILEARQQLEYCELIPEMFQNGAETCVPCPNDLFDGIIQINYLRAILERRIIDIESDHTNIDRKQEVKPLLEKILSFSVSQWANDMSDRFYKFTNAHPNRDTQRSLLRPKRRDWVRIASIYQASVTLYCVRSLALDLDGLLHIYCDSDPSIPISYVSVSDILVVAKQTLFDRLRDVLSYGYDTSESFGKVVAWPVFVAGVEAATDPKAAEFRSEISSALSGFSRAVGALSTYDLKLFLEKLWAHVESLDDNGHERPLWWNDLLQSSPGRSIFFM
ncbi:hypothetical protein FQN57_005186 [Myotisia sp. PD_48]|nr:hypothetical protein FQN57_005186 [Myotisia sp. PD_48]